jgi:hypothetical protein
MPAPLLVVTVMFNTRFVFVYASSKVTSPTLALRTSSNTPTSRKDPSFHHLFARPIRVPTHVLLPVPVLYGRLVKAVKSIFFPVKNSSSSSSVCTPTKAAINAPVAVPAIIRGNRPRRCNAFTTPK